MRIPMIAQAALAGGLGFVGVLAVTAPEQTLPIIQSAMPVPVSTDCNIKGNISINTGEGAVRRMRTSLSLPKATEY